MTQPGQYSAVERHPQYDRIVQAMAGRTMSDKQIAAAPWLKPPLDRTTLWRFRKTKLEAKLQQAALGPATVAATLQAKGLLADTDAVNQAVSAVVAATQASIGGDRYLERVEKHRATVDRSLIAAEADGDGRTVAALVGVDLRGLELDARLTGRLDSAQSTTNNFYVVSPMVSGPPRPEPRVIDVDVSK